MNSSINPEGFAEKVNSGINPGNLAERVNSGINSRDLAEKVNSGTNLRDLVENVNSDINLGDLAERVISSPRSGGASQGDLEANSSGVSSGPPLPVDTRVLRDLEVMKVEYDLDTVVTEGSLVVIRGGIASRPNTCCMFRGPGSAPTVRMRPTYWMDLSDLHGMPKMSSGKAPSTRVIVPTREVGVSHAREATKTSSKRPIDAPTEQADDPARRHKKVKVPTRRHKSQHGEGESCSHSKGKEPTAPSEEPETPAESDEGDASPVHHRPRSMKDLFKTKVHKGDAVYDTLQMSDPGHQDPDKEMKARWRVEELDGSMERLVEECASELEQELKKTKRERDKALQRLEASENELNEVRSNLAEIQRLLKEAQVRARKMDDELLQGVKALENARAELPRQAVDRYKESIGFKDGLKRMGRITYEYGYRVALACFHALHPDSEVEEDPFTILPKDDLMPMERQQAFDDLDPPES
ncbi:hypothetical protein B296_00038311 [Ensete ventricosum]|uniref:Uncharacterized protein n=1 Tax=Ensete ventricosum TaxID=4639 RepID=A0A426Z4H1_ENSVE|nr:hypothetical protein B296_00038311 [Ensete ventricosum]